MSQIETQDHQRGNREAYREYLLVRHVLVLRPLQCAGLLSDPDPEYMSSLPRHKLSHRDGRARHFRRLPASGHSAAASDGRRRRTCLQLLSRTGDAHIPARILRYSSSGNALSVCVETDPPDATNKIILA